MLDLREGILRTVNFIAYNPFLLVSRARRLAMNTNGDIPLDAVGTVAEPFDTVTVEQECHTPALLSVA